MFRVRPFADGRGSQGSRFAFPIYRSIPGSFAPGGGVLSSFMDLINMSCLFEVRLPYPIDKS